MSMIPTKLLSEFQFEKKTWANCKKGYTHFQDGDVLLAKITPCFENGKSALATGLPNGIGAGSTEYFVLRSQQLEPRFLHAFVKTKQFKDDCIVRMSGSVGHKRVPKDYLMEYPVPLPPLNEQTRIADKLDSLLSKVDAAQTRLEKIPTLLQRFRQAVLAAATSGELTREWRDSDETYDDFLTWEFSNLPKSWQLKLLPEISEARLGKMLDKNKNQGIATSYLGNINVRWRAFDLSDLKKILVSDKEQKELQIKDGDLLLCEGGEPGRGAVWKGGKNNLTFQKALHRVRFSKNFSADYALICVENDFHQKKLSQLYTGTTIKHLTGKALKKYPIPVPPLEEQKEIVRRVESLFALADAVEKQYFDARQRTDRLTQSLLAKAFRGELVPQDPNDEPASQLLKRIQAEREQQAATKPKRKASTRQSPSKARTTAMKLMDAPENYLTELLLALGGEAHAEVLWKKTELSIDDFYAKLKQEMKNGGIIDDKRSDDAAQRKLKIVVETADTTLND